MPDELEKLGQPTTETESAPAEETAPSAPQKTASQPDFEQLMAELNTIKQENAETKRFIGEQARAIGDLRNENSYLGQMAQGRFGPQAPIGPKPITDDDFIARPVEAANQLYEQRAAAERQQRELVDQRRAMDQAKYSVDVGFKAATERWPEVFKGIEPEAYNSIAFLVKNGSLSPYHAMDPNSWAAAALMIKGQKEGYDKFLTGQKGPVRPTETMLPNATKPGAASADEDLSGLDSDALRLAKEFGLKDEQVKEAVKESRGRR